MSRHYLQALLSALPNLLSARAIVLSALASLVAGCSALPTTDDYTGVNNNAVASASATGAAVRECRWSGATGTKMRTRICHSAEQWAQIDAANDPAQDNDAFFRRQREGATVQNNVEQPDITGGF